MHTEIEPQSVRWIVAIRPNIELILQSILYHSHLAQVSRFEIRLEGEMSLPALCRSHCIVSSILEETCAMIHITCVVHFVCGEYNYDPNFTTKQANSQTSTRKENGKRRGHLGVPHNEQDIPDKSAR